MSYINNCILYNYYLISLTVCNTKLLPEGKQYRWLVITWTIFST